MWLTTTLKDPLRGRAKSAASLRLRMPAYSVSDLQKASGGYQPGNNMVVWYKGTSTSCECTEPTCSYREAACRQRICKNESYFPDHKTLEAAAQDVETKCALDPNQLYAMYWTGDQWTKLKFSGSITLRTYKLLFGFKTRDEVKRIAYLDRDHIDKFFMIREKDKWQMCACNAPPTSRWKTRTCTADVTCKMQEVGAVQ